MSLETHRNSPNNADRLKNSTKKQQISNGTDFVRCRIGIQVDEFVKNPTSALGSNQLADFILIPIQSPKASIDRDDYSEVIPDLVLTQEDWLCKVALKLDYPLSENSDIHSAREFDKLLRHAIYLSTSVIVISCPNSESALLSIASIINDRLRERPNGPMILFKVPFGPNYNAFRDSNQTTDRGSNSQSYIRNNKPGSAESTSGSSSDWGSDWEDSGLDELTTDGGLEPNNSVCAWRQWNSIRCHLNSDKRIGVCLGIDDNLIGRVAELSRWTGEPVKMMILRSEQFSNSSSLDDSVKLNNVREEFITKVALANSAETCFVVQGRRGQNLVPFISHLYRLAETIKQKHFDEYLSDWDDALQTPLQPLASNLDSVTYRTFEMDHAKYLAYREAMVEAIIRLESRCEELVVMILGAGRGPLVDSFIRAIKIANPKQKFKIFAVEKNPSSIVSLRFRNKRDWTKSEVHIFEHDMRTWNPKVKADIIVTELLGSLADNELSPECLDGVWRLCQPHTISIPQEYSSYIAPICSHKLHQKLREHKNSGNLHVYDRIYVVKLKNCYHISQPKRLFNFDHYNLSSEPTDRCNERYARLKFKSSVDTVCHGFSGYFTANLFASTPLSTLLGPGATPNMYSWFPAFIPLEQPIEMPKGTKMEVHFWRKESPTKVWYEWVLTKPRRTRFHSPNGLSSAMSKFI